MARTLRIVNYAVNGAGVGHLVRLIAINRWIRRYAWHAGVRPEIYFLTSSEADGLLFTEGFASFKMPSKTSVAETGIDKLAYLALAKQWVWHSLGLLRPDILVVDTFPRGSFGELLSALDLCRHRAFVYRPLKAAFAARPDFQAMLPLYDAIVVPEHAGADVTIPDEARGRVRFVGPVMARERAELLARGEARARCGVREGCVVVYLSAGGGGDPGAAETLAALVDALAADETLHLVVGAGPLYRGQPFAGSRLTWLPTGLAAELMGAFDAAICASGYNSYHELMHAGVPAIFLPQAKVADVQGERARRAVDAGAAVMLDPGSDARAIRSALGELREKLPEAAAAARALVPRNHARDAAAEILRLALSPGEVDAAEEAVSDAVLEAERAGIPAEASIETMRLLAGET
ncbi:MAG: glycosyltransferase, partial [Acidobacteriota bacterium]